MYCGFSSRRPFAPFTIHGNNHPGVPPAAAGNAPFGLASLAAASTSSAGSGADLSAFVGGFGAVTGANASPMFGSGPSGSGFGGFPAIPSTSTAPSGLMLPNLPSTSAQAPDANAGISNDAYLSYLQQYAMLLNQQGAGNQGGLGTPGASGSAPGSSFLMLNQGPPPPQQLQQPSIPQPQPSLLSVFQAQQQHPQPLDYAALADAQQRRQSASFSSPAIHQAPPQPPNQQLTLSALQALQQAPNAAFLQALMPPPPQPQPQPPPPQQPLQQQLFSDEFLLSELQRGLSRREAAAIQAQQQAQQIQAFQQAIQQGVIPASQTQQLLALLQQQLRPQAPQPPPPQPPPPQPAPMAFAAPGLGTPRPPMTPQMVMTPTLNPGLNLMHSIRPSTSTTPSGAMRFMGGDDIHKKLSQSSLMSMSASPHGASPPKRNSMSMSSSQPIPRKISMVSTAQQHQSSSSYQSPPRMASSSTAMPPPQLPQQQSQPSSSTQMPPPQPMDSIPSSSVPGPSTSASSSARPSAYRSPMEPTGLPVQPYYPTHFFKGTAIQMANGLVKQVENMQPEDFANSRYVKAGMRVSIGKLVEISPTQCCKQIVVRYLSDIDGDPIEGVMTANCEYPFYEMDHGWSSYDPAKTLNLYGLNCRPIALGDKCFFLARPTDGPVIEAAAAEQANRAKRQQLHSLQSGSDSRPASRNAATSSQRLNRKSIPPPLVMDGASSSASSSFQAPHPPPTERIISSSSMTPSSSTISAPAASRPRPVFNLESTSTSNPNTMELYSAPAAMDDLTVAGEEPSTPQGDDNAMEVDVDDTPGPSQPASSIPAPSNPTDTDVILDFNI